MSDTNPIATLTSRGPSASKVTLPIAGIHVDIYGLSELPPAATSVSCLWLHHPRLRSKEAMADIASLAISAWNSRASTSRGLIAVAFDQRNHGTRLVNDLSNQAWRQGNRTHAQDMFNIVSGTVVDTSHLIDALEGYLFGNGDGPGAPSGNKRAIDQHLALGVSLGGHSIWQAMFAEPRITAGIIVIGCPDYVSLLTDRARLSKLSTYSKFDNGASFVGSKDFPTTLVAACKKYDPRGILFGTDEISFPTSDDEKERLKPILDSHIRGKRFQVLSGGKDKLVPYAQSEPILDFIKTAATTWYRVGGISIEDIVYPEARHEFNVEMMNDATRFIVEVVSEKDAGHASTSKI